MRCASRPAVIEHLESRQLLAISELSATVISVAPAQLRLNWNYIEHWTNTIEHRIYRRAKGDATSWGTPIVTLTNAKNTLSWTDTTLSAGMPYEYRVETYANGGLGDWGYVSGGVNLPLVENRGKVLILVDQSQAAALAPELAQLQADLAGDGWTVLRSDLPRATVEASAVYTPAVGAARLAELTAVKSVIVNAYNADPANVKSVFIIGHLPLPYSGNNAPDGHVPDHQGAWPADTYYADVNGTWTDTSVSTTAPTDPRNDNVIGDGKFDQTTISSDLELQVGRIDFTDMTQAPGAPFGETELLRSYLRRDHDYRFRQNAYTNIERRAVVINAFAPGTGSPTMIPSIYSTLGAAGTIDYPSYPGATGPWFRWMEENPDRTYLIGSAQTAGGSTGNGAGSSRDFGLRPSRSVFNVMFGSYLGDIGYTDNFMRASIAGNATGDSLGLTSWWAGRPNLYLPSMGLGETIGYSSRVSQNNNGSLYDAGYFPRGTHTLLLGDPTLRMYMVQPPQNFQATTANGEVALSWSPSTEAGLIGYVVYRGTSASGPFTKLTSSPTSGTTYTDATAIAGTGYVYLVKTAKLETTPAGTFQNTSQATMAVVTPFGGGTPTPLAPTSLQAVAPTSNAISLSWIDNATNETGYRVERRTGATGAFATIGTLAADATAFSDPDMILPGTINYYRVFAVGASGDSIASREVWVNGYVGSIGFAGDVTTLTRNSGVNFVDVLVTRVGGSTGTATVNYATFDNGNNDTAKPGVDYTATSGTLTFADGETQKMIRVNLLAAQPHLPISFSMNLTSPSAGSGLTQRATTRVVVADASSPLQSPWQSGMLGYGIAEGAVGQVGGEIGAAFWGGNWNGSSENGRFIYQTITGDNVLTVKITAPNIEAVALMVRSNLTNPNGKMVSIRLTNGSTGAQQVTRTTDTSWPNTVITEPSTSNNIKAPYWVRMTRSGDQFSSEVSPDGTVWSALATQSVPGMPAAALWGFFLEVNQYVPIQRAVFSDITISSVAAPVAPTNLTGLRSGAGAVLNWTDGSANESGFRIERRLAGTGSFVEVGTTAANITTYTDPTAAAASSYEYRVCAYNSAGNSDYSNVVLVGPLAIPEAPTALTVTGDVAGDFTLSWTDNSSVEEGFSIERRSEGGVFAEIATTFSGRWIDATPLYDTGYEYRVRSYNAAGYSAYTNVVAVANLAGQDMTVTTGAGQGADAQISNANPTTNYGSTTTFAITSTTVVTDSYLRFDLAGAPSGSAWFVNGASVSAIFASVPNPSTYFYANAYMLSETANAWDESTITWANAPYNSSMTSGPALSGHWYHYASGGIAAGVSFPWFDNGFASQLGARIAAGATVVTLYATTYTGSNYNASFAADEHASYAPPTLSASFRKRTPRRATNLSGSVLAPDGVSLQWSDNASDETGYRIEVSTDGGATYSPVTTLAANTTSFSASPVAGGSRMYRVVALNSYGDATASLPTTVLVPTPPTVSSFTINDGAAQRSMIKELTVVFSEAVTVDPGAITVKTRLGASLANVLVSTANPSADGRTYVLTFTGDAVIGGSLADGMYRLAITASGVRDLDGDAMAANYTSQFHRLFGDFDGDRDVDTADLSQFRKAMNKPLVYSTYWFFDFQGDGKVDNGDYLQLKSRLTRSVLR